MSEYDNRKKELKNAVFWVIFAFFLLKRLPISGLTLHCQNYYVFLKKIEFYSCSLVRNTANTSNREEQGNTHADMPFCGVFHCIIPVTMRVYGALPFYSPLAMLFPNWEKILGRGSFRLSLCWALSGSLGLRQVDLRPFSIS